MGEREKKRDLQILTSKEIEKKVDTKLAPIIFVVAEISIRKKK